MIDTIDITTSQRKTILEMLKRYLPDTEVWAYGSRVKWTSRPESDLDMVVFASPDQKRQVSDLKEALEESDLPFRVDVFEWAEVPEGFRKNIEAEHVVLQKQSERSRVIGSEWRQSTWGEEISLEYGKGLRGYKDAEGQYRVYGSNGPVGWTYKSLAPGPGVILGRKGVYRGVEYSKEPFFVIDTAYYVKPKNNLHMRWLYYAIKYYKLGEIDDGSPIPSTTRAAVYVRELQVPPPETQRAIAHILGSLDDKIELNRQMNRTLEKMAQAIFKSWFIDFDPVRAKAEGRDPGLPKDIAGLFPDSFEDSELGEIPKGWEVKPIGDVLVLAYGKSLPKKKRQQGNIPVYGSGGVSGFHNDHLVQGPGIIVGRKGTVGSVYWEEENFFPIDTVFYVDLKGSMPLYWVFLRMSLMDIQKLGADSAVPGVNRNAIHAQKWVVPTGKIVEQFQTISDGLLRQAKESKQQVGTLSNLRDTLLPKLISGELPIPDAEKFIEDARI